MPEDDAIDLDCTCILNARPLAARGRGRPLAVATCDPSEQTITVRIDTYDAPYPWYEVTLTREDLLALLTPPPEAARASVAAELEAWRTGDFTETVSTHPLPPRTP
jgi:hypothetical protein